MIRLKDIKIREDLSTEQIFQKAISKNKIKASKNVKCLLV